MLTSLITLAIAMTPAPSPGVIVPMYGDVDRMWRRLAAAPPTRPTTAIANLGNGPGTSRDPQRAELLERARAAGIHVVGYVYTRYGRRPLARVRRDVARWEQWYGVDGIFVDNVASTRPRNFAYYRSVSRTIRGSRGRLVVMNGWATADYMKLTDVLLMFEGNLAGFRRVRLPEWTRSFDASRFASIVYGVPGSAAMRTVLDDSAARNVGTVYVTDRRRPHPYRSLSGFLGSLIGSTPR